MASPKGALRTGVAGTPGGLANRDFWVDNRMRIILNPLPMPSTSIFPVIAWAVFALLLWGRYAKGVTGRRSAMLAIAGFAFALLTFVGMVR